MGYKVCFYQDIRPQSDDVISSNWFTLLLPCISDSLSLHSDQFGHGSSKDSRQPKLELGRPGNGRL